MIKRFNDACTALCNSLFTHVFNISDDVKENAQEIRLRINRPLSVVCPDQTYYLTANSGYTNTILKQGMLITTRSEIMDTFQNICNYSIYSRQNEIRSGFVTMQGGHRAGICGTAVINGSIISGIRDISSINIRIANEIFGCSNAVYQRVGKDFSGILICGSPCSGKTTIIRDLARVLSLKNKNVSVIDTRGEIAGIVNGVHQNDIGMCDILDGYPKSEGIDQAVRCLSPEYIICDEIGSNDDIHSILQGINSGIKFTATAHCADLDELKSRRNLFTLFENGFNCAVFLKTRANVGQIDKIYTAEEIINA